MENQQNEESKKYEEIETCSICGRKLNFWNTQLKTYEGKKICTSCAWKLTKKEMGEIKGKQKPANKLFRKMFFLGIIGLFFILGLITFPVGIIFWIINIFLLIRIFKN
jgi:hypothetical protein